MTAIGAAYANTIELANRVGSQHVDDADELAEVMLSASREVESHCRRQFNQVVAATARSFIPTHRELVKVADFYSTDDLVIATDDTGNGTFDTTWSASDYQLEPLDGVVDGQPGWPYWRIRAVGSRSLPCLGRRATVRVTAKWGWAAVPPPVKQAALIIASETYKLREAPLGVAGFGEFGVVRVRDNPMAASRLAPYVRDPVMVA